MQVTSVVRDRYVTLPIMPKAPPNVNAAGSTQLPQNSRRPRPRFKHSRAGFSGDVSGVRQKTLGSRFRGNDDIKDPGVTLFRDTQ